jgi:AraC-like DNA-binding protein
VVEQAGREAALEAGDFTVVDWSRPARWATASERAVSLMFPRALLALPHEQVARLGGVRISGRRGAGALFSSFVRQVVAHLDDYGAADGARLGTTIVDLLTAALAARPVSAIAARWGLVDPAHFSRLFRATYGVPPLDYRRTMGRAPSPG